MICNKAECVWNGNGCRCNNTLITQLVTEGNFECYKGLLFIKREDGKFLKIDKRVI